MGAVSRRRRRLDRSDRGARRRCSAVSQYAIEDVRNDLFRILSLIAGVYVLFYVAARAVRDGVMA